MTTIERTSHFSSKQTSVDPEEDISRQLQLFQTLSKAYMKHYCKIEVKLDNTYGLANHIETLAKVGDEIEAKHRTLFKGMLKRLEIAKQPLTEIKEILHRVFDEMFADNHFNWGRIVTVFVFGACVSKCLIDNKKSELAESVADYVGESVHNRAHKWVAKQGGWVSNMVFKILNNFIKLRKSFIVIR